MKPRKVFEQLHHLLHETFYFSRCDRLRIYDETDEIFLSVKGFQRVGRTIVVHVYSTYSPKKLTEFKENEL